MVAQPAVGRPVNAFMIRRSDMDKGVLDWRRIVQVCLTAVGLGLLAHVLWTNRAAFREVMSHRPDFRLMTLAVALYLAGFVATFLRWRVLVRAQGIPLGVWEAIRVGFIGNA